MVSASVPDESGVQQDVLRWLESLDYETYGLAEDESEGASVLDEAYERDPTEVIYYGMLREWLVDSEVSDNDQITEDNVDDFLTSLRRDLSHDSANLVEANEEFHRLLVRGKRFAVTSEEGKETKRIFVRLVNLRDIENNRFVAADEFRVKRGGNSIRPDVNLFVNGIPLVTMELKSLAQENDYYDAISDLRDYEEDVSRLFVPNLWNVAADSMAYRYGAVGATSSFYMPWEADEEATPPEYRVEEEDANPLKEPVLAMCNHETLLDILRNFVFYEHRTGGTAKIIPRYMQYYAANRIVDRVREGRTDPEMRRGLIWHTQGSGKSFTMLYAARLLLERGVLDHPKVVLVVDTKDLEDQMAQTLNNLGGFEQFTRAKSIRHLEKRLQTEQSELIVTTIQKFENVESNLQREQPTVVMSDEAHRFMEKDLGNRLAAALPDAFHFGFTGTPVRESERDTFANYRPEGKPDELYLHYYSIGDGIDDDLILPVHFTLRHDMEWDIDAEAIDAEFDREFADLSIDEKQEVIEKYLTATEISELRPRVEEVVWAGEQRGIIDHFEETVRPNNWKGMVVTPSRKAAAIYGEELQKYYDPEEVAVLYTSTGDDSETVRQFHTTPEERDAIVEDFKDPDKDPKLLVVVDMLLTGFDAPVLKTMYLDRNLKNHNLLQAIARTNRPDDGKHNGEIVDYQGVYASLDDALDYGSDVTDEIRRDRKQLLEETEQLVDDLMGLFEGIPQDNRQETLNKCLARLSKPQPKRDFKQGYRELQDLYETLSPDKELVESGIQDDYKWLTNVYIAFRRNNNREEKPEKNLREKTTEIIADNVEIEEIKSYYETYKLGERHLQQVDQMTEPAAKANAIEHATREHLQPRVDRNPRYRSLSEKLEDIVDRWRHGELEDPDAVEKLERVERDVIEFEEDLEEHGLNEAQHAIYSELTENYDGEVADEDEAERIATDLWEQFDAEVDRFDGWETHAETRKQIRRLIIRRLAKEHGKVALAKDDQFLEQTIEYLVENAE
ncbi:type I restriction endonuclease subunit R [Natrinema altunense]|uniref:type I site-specific deoxyribonuclease n=1 Tax=Natrinema altunense TaxID=222984 RepID=A0A482Y372_9EURY|nr:type I restriction endonuclease subunit R [Natrinema altunense]RZH68764.1 type I restriction endonuclease subunit R [Natrinema altunense]